MSDPRQADIPEELRLRGFAEERAPTEAEVARGKPAEHAWGVQYQGSFEAATDGNARAVRLHARALAATGLPLVLQSFTGRFVDVDGKRYSAEATPDRVKQEIFELQHASIASIRVQIKHAVIHDADFLRSWIVPQYIMRERDPELLYQWTQNCYKRTIVYSVWERTTIAENILSILRRVAECWVPSEHNKRLLEAHGVERVVVVPHPWESSSPLARMTARVPIPMKRFYAIGIWQPRKAFHELIGAFLRAFMPGEAVHLTIKFREARFEGYPSPEQSVDHWLADPVVRENGWRMENLKPHLALRSEHWTEAQIQELHYKSNIYVAASHGEAFCLPAFDAKVAGSRMVYTPWGGQSDFAEAGDVLVPYELEPVPASYRWEPGAQWASVDVAALSRALVEVKAPPRFVRGERVEAMRFERVGALMRERVERVLKENE